MTAAVSITTLYMQTHETTLAITAVRSEITKQASENNYEIIVEKVTITKGIDTNVNIQIINGGNETITFDESSLKNQIENTTSFRNINIKISQR